MKWLMLFCALSACRATLEIQPDHEGPWEHDGIHISMHECLVFREIMREREPQHGWRCVGKEQK